MRFSMTLKKPLSALLLAIAGSLLAQTSGAIGGTVTDQSGASVANAKVVATSSTTGERREASSSASVQYSFPFLAPGHYRIEASHTGFTTSAANAPLAVTQ